MGWTKIQICNIFPGLRKDFSRYFQSSSTIPLVGVFINYTRAQRVSSAAINSSLILPFILTLYPNKCDDKEQNMDITSGAVTNFRLEVVPLKLYHWSHRDCIKSKHHAKNKCYRHLQKESGKGVIWSWSRILEPTDTYELLKLGVVARCHLQTAKPCVTW